MWALLSRVFGSILIGTCLSSFAVLLMSLFLTIRNLPNILTSLQRLVRTIFRYSFRLYNAILSRLRRWVFQHAGFDLFHPITRVICTGILSITIGTSMLAIFSQPILEWELIFLAAHGAFVGLAWDGILRSEDFQLGANLE